jgi:hypothetical protein
MAVAIQPLFASGGKHSRKTIVRVIDRAQIFSTLRRLVVR